MTSTGNLQANDYRYKRDVTELRYFYVLNPASPHRGWALRELIQPAFRALHAEYGVTVQPLAYGAVPEPRPDGVTYVIYGPTNPLTMPVDEQGYLAALAATGARTNIISAYPLSETNEDRPDYAMAATWVPELCDLLDVNAIFPDEVDLSRGIRTNTWQDVYVNAIGETIRVKYQPTQSVDPGDRAVLHRLRQEHDAEIVELARVHRDHHLWQRKPYTDGSIMFTHDGHWFASQTVTDKSRMTADDFDLITSFDEGTAGLTYTGPRLPSSDAPEFLMLSSVLGMHGRRPRLIVHFHHRELTRGARYRELVTDARIEGGRFSAGRLFYRELCQKQTDWFIIREHGMVWTGDSVAQFEEFVHRVVVPGG
ncbi:hypothetical protein ACFPIJ_61090 [Dactylosporangium cerinum]|uniref:Uncharacterized protein n=1 Tax=Dactylosporangium cerinum TaxID=1434730 RepID=A0ABV9WJ21_9ACTN